MLAAITTRLNPSWIEMNAQVMYPYLNFVKESLTASDWQRRETKIKRIKDSFAMLTLVSYLHYGSILM